MKIALVHDFLIKLGGAERVLKIFSDLFPDAPIYTLLFDEDAVKGVFPVGKIRPSFLQKYYKKLKSHKLLLSKMPRAMEEFDFDDFDLVISSSNSFAHGIITSIQTKHLCYCHSPMRYAWDWTNEYKTENNIYGLKKVIYAPLINYLRNWDFIASDRPDKYLANSHNVRKRINKYYGLDSEVLYPPVDVARFTPSKKHSDFFLIVSTLTPYKRIELAIELFNKTGRRLIVIGEGPQRDYLEQIAGESIDFFGFKSDETVKEYLQNCRAFIFPGEDDFGIAPVEAMACGKPVLAYGKGGALETVVSGKTGEFFYEPDISSMEDALARLLYNEKFYNALEIRKHAEKFSRDNFEKQILRIIKNF